MSDQGPDEGVAASPSLILFVDDDDNQRESYRIRLEHRGYRVRAADGADAAMQALREERPDVVILDIAMPERDGLSALQELLDADPGLPVVIHTAYPSYAESFLAWAADAYVVKSQDMAPLLDAIEKAVGRASSGGS
jgi:DNA-binding NtrC family response regulator